jgi:hypothetical protein
MTDLEQKWNMQYVQLVEFKRKKGHCLVPKRYEHDESLGDWVSKQRVNQKNNKIRADRKTVLDEIGFVWTVERATNTHWHQTTAVLEKDKKWNMHYEHLVEFKRENDHCMVPRSYERDKFKSLGQWVRTQRNNHKNNKIRLDRKKLLDDLDFVWRVEGYRNIIEINDKVWHQQYEKLVEFKRKMGHCLVPGKYEQDRSLGRWVRAQREFHTTNKIRLDREELLDEIEFVWKAVPGPPRTSSRRRRRNVGLPSEALVEGPKQAQEYVRNRFECPSRNRKRQRTRLDYSRELAGKTTQRGKTRGSPSSSCVEDDVDGLDEEDSNPSLVTSSARIDSDPGQEVVQGEEATTLCAIPSGWARVKLEPDC